MVNQYENNLDLGDTLKRHGGIRANVVPVFIHHALAVTYHAHLFPDCFKTYSDVNDYICE